MTKFQLYQELNNLSGRGEYVRSCVISFFNFSVPVTIASESYLPLKFHGGRGRNRAENSADLINSFSDILAPRITEGTKGAKELEGRGGGGGKTGEELHNFSFDPRSAYTERAPKRGVPFIPLSRVRSLLFFPSSSLDAVSRPREEARDPATETYKGWRQREAPPSRY